jgi:hypothetical protein
VTGYALHIAHSANTLSGQFVSDLLQSKVMDDSTFDNLPVLSSSSLIGTMLHRRPYREAHSLVVSPRRVLRLRWDQHRGCPMH